MNALNFAGSDRMKWLKYILKLHILLIMSQTSYSAMFFFQRSNNAELEDMLWLHKFEISDALYKQILPIAMCYVYL